ncbi:hypothetical protein DRP04_08520 [Archaeoglobales archaeon]|nr:MAG: hypothetical protein DRP04_08520 [Archaeoglobales archaeon]
MKIYGLAIFLLCINISIALVSETGIFGEVTGYNRLHDSFNTSIFEATAERLNATGGVLGVAGQLIDLAAFITEALRLLFAVFINTTLGLPLMLKNPPFEFPDIIVNMLMVLQIVIYLAGLIEFLRGASLD